MRRDRFLHYGGDESKAEDWEGMDRVEKEEQPTPQPGDEWEFKLPGKRKRVKQVGSVVQRFGKRVDGTEGEYDYVNWHREPKGRYSGLSVYLLMLHGRRISTKAERDAHLEMLIERARQRREANKQ